MNRTIVIVALAAALLVLPLFTNPYWTDVCVSIGLYALLGQEVLVRQRVRKKADELPARPVREIKGEDVLGGQQRAHRLPVARQIARNCFAFARVHIAGSMCIAQ